MGTITPKVVFAGLVTAVALAATIPTPSAQNATAEEFTAFAINLNSRAGGGPAAARPTTAQLRIRVERWSTPEERDSLTAIMKEETDVTRMNSAMLRALQQMPRVGWIRGSQTLAWDLRYAQQTPLPEGGRRIMLGTDRPIGMWEARNQPRSIDYPFTILELRLDKNNQGEGKMIGDTRLIFNRDTNSLVLENYDISPVRLNQIRRSN